MTDQSEQTEGIDYKQFYKYLQDVFLTLDHINSASIEHKVLIKSNEKKARQVIESRKKRFKLLLRKMTKTESEMKIFADEFMNFYNDHVNEILSYKRAKGREAILWLLNNKEPFDIIADDDDEEELIALNLTNYFIMAYKTQQKVAKSVRGASPQEISEYDELFLVDTIIMKIYRIFMVLVQNDKHKRKIKMIVSRLEEALGINDDEPDGISFDFNNGLSGMMESVMGVVKQASDSGMIPETAQNMIQNVTNNEEVARAMSDINNDIQSSGGDISRVAGSLLQNLQRPELTKAVREEAKRSGMNFNEFGIAQENDKSASAADADQAGQTKEEEVLDDEEEVVEE